jgi:beta-1,4-mannosyl-glycoprotein beta-1,4-N-acetylglucosaminyltransferase
MEIIDTFHFNNEIELLDLRVHILEDIVDKFIVKEADETFTRNPKKCLAALYDHPKVFTHKVELPDGTPWERDTYQKTAKVNLDEFGISSDALIMMSDVDEMPSVEAIHRMTTELKYGMLCRFMQRPFQRFLNVEQIGQPWSGTRVCLASTYHLLNDGNFSHHMPAYSIGKGGWHWSFLGDTEMIIDKIKSYGHTQFNTPETIRLIDERVANSQDVLGRTFRFRTVDIDETYPVYIRENQDKLRHLIKLK